MGVYAYKPIVILLFAQITTSLFTYKYIAALIFI